MIKITWSQIELMDFTEPSKGGLFDAWLSRSLKEVSLKFSVQSRQQKIGLVVEVCCGRSRSSKLVEIGWNPSLDLPDGEGGAD